MPTPPPWCSDTHVAPDAQFSSAFSIGQSDTASEPSSIASVSRLGEATEPAILTVTIGSENQVAGLEATSVVSTGYGNSAQPLAKLGVLGPTRMDYPGTMGAVRAVARYVGQILMES